MLRRFLSEYRHTDGSRWVGPDFYANSFEQAQLYAASYPVQPILVMGEHVETIEDGEDITVRYQRSNEVIFH